MKFGYARVSTSDQNLDLQTDALKAAGCEEVFTEKLSSTKKDKPELTSLVSKLRKGDCVVVWKLDRIARSVQQLTGFIAELQSKEVNFQSIQDNIDTTTSQGRFFFHVMCSVAEFERDLISARTKAGIESARKRGRIGGKPRSLTIEQIESAKKLLEAGQAVSVTARALNVNRSTIYRSINYK